MTQEFLRNRLFKPFRRPRTPAPALEPTRASNTSGRLAGGIEVRVAGSGNMRSCPAACFADITDHGDENVSETRRPLLIVEDDPALQVQMKWAFDAYEVALASNREEAIAGCGTASLPSSP